MTNDEAHALLASIVAAPGQTLPRLQHTGFDNWSVGDETKDQPHLFGLSFVAAVQEYARRAAGRHGDSQ